MIGRWLFGGETVQVACNVDIEQTPDSFHAYAVPEDIQLRPGDKVFVHDAPSGVAFGERISVKCQATVTRAGWLLRTWTQLTGVFELPELYEVGFLPKEEP